MARYVVGRLIGFVPILLIMVALVFLVHNILPGDVVEIIIGPQGLGVSITEEQLQAMREELGLTLPLHMRLLRYIEGIFRGDFGRSIFTRQPVARMIREVLPYTLQLVTAGMLFALAFGIVLGILASSRAGSWIDDLSMLVSTIGMSTPDFWLGLVLTFVFALRLGWLPAIGQGSVRHLILPATTLGTGAMCLIARVTRSSILEVLREEYVTTARAKGLGERAVLLRHVFRNAMIPIVTMVSLQIGRFIAGSVIIETVFARRGIGRLLITAILDKDFPVAQGVVLVIGTAVLTINLVVDLLYVIIDPRIRYT